MKVKEGIMRIELHPNADVEDKGNILLSEDNNQVQNMKGRAISKYYEKQQKDGSIKRYFEIEETSGRHIIYTWTVGTPLVLIFAKEIDELIGFGFIIDELFKNKPISLEKNWAWGYETCQAYCLDCIRG